MRWAKVTSMVRFSMLWKTAATCTCAVLIGALAGCGATSGTVRAGAATASGSAGSADGGPVPGTSAPLSTPAASGPSGAPADTPAPLHTSVSPAWVLTTPASVFGFARVQPSAANLQKITDALTKSAAPLGVSGTPVIAVYDDPQHDVYIILAGYNGQGLDPAKLPPLFNVQPVYTNDGSGDRVTLNSQTIDAGDHGGTAGCSSQVLQMGGLATEGTVCTWLTATTMGSVSYYPKPDEKQMVFGAGPDVMGKVMRDMRDLVEKRR